MEPCLDNGGAWIKEVRIREVPLYIANYYLTRSYDILKQNSLAVKKGVAKESRINLTHMYL